MVVILTNSFIFILFAQALGSVQYFFIFAILMDQFLCFSMNKNNSFGNGQMQPKIFLKRWIVNKWSYWMRKASFPNISCIINPYIKAGVIQKKVLPGTFGWREPPQTWPRTLGHLSIAPEPLHPEVGGRAGHSPDSNRQQRL